MALGTYRTNTGLRISKLIERYAEGKVVAALSGELYAEGQGILTQSRELCPVDTGALRASGYVSVPVRQGQYLVMEIGYGGVAAQVNPKTGQSTDGYALIVHENLEAFHPVGQAKYLEVPFNAARPGMSNRLVNGTRARLRGGTLSAPVESVIDLTPEGLLPGGGARGRR